MSTLVLNKNADCLKCVHFGLEGHEEVCYEFHQIIYDSKPLCSAFEPCEEDLEVKNDNSI